MKRALKYVAAILGATAIVVSVTLIIANRRATEVVVVDEAGVPLADAEVAPQSLSINYPSRFTNAAGATRLPVTLQPIRWIVVRKCGYQDYWSGEIGGLKRVVVVLKKQPRNGVLPGCHPFFAHRC
jgi:hypothetical protein